jgi:DNA primase catalytic subunit
LYFFFSRFPFSLSLSLSFAPREKSEKIYSLFFFKMEPAERFYRVTTLTRPDASFFGSLDYPVELLLAFMAHFGRRQCCVTSFDATRGISYAWLGADATPDTPDALRALLVRHGAGLHFGLIVREVNALAWVGARAQSTHPAYSVKVQRELVFDLDLRDKPERIALCRCTAQEACRICWLLAELAVAIFRHWLTQLVGLGRPLVVYSGGKGLHVWFGNVRARSLTAGQRRTIGDILRAGAVPPPMTPEGQRAPAWAEFMDAILLPLFESRGLQARQLWDGPDGAATLFGAHIRAVMGVAAAESAERRASAPTGVARWAALRAFESADRVRDTVWQLAWPVVDASVLDQRTHAIKAPFSLHHTTLRLALPLDDAALRDCDPATMPRLPLLPAHAPLLGRARSVLETWLRECGYLDSAGDNK